jgi:predicted enzyme related to lactoylglutathione lyase
MASLKRINVIFIYVGNMSVMRKFYEETLKLGAPVVESDLWIEYELPGTHLALHQGDPRVVESQNLSHNRVRFSLEVDDIDTICKELKENGIEFTFGPKKDFGSFLAEFKDPESNLIRLIQYK